MHLDSLRLAARNLRKQPAFTTAVVVSLALGISLNTTMYGMLDALIKPHLDMRDPGRLYRVAFYGDMRNQIANRTRDAALASGMHTYEAITYTTPGAFGNQVIEYGETVHEGSIQFVAPNYFDVLGTRPLVGRTFIPADTTADIQPIVISDALQTQLFVHGESPIGERIKVRNQLRVIVGVVRHSANLPGDNYAAWEIGPYIQRGAYIRLLRLRPGATPQDADRELSVIANRFALETGESPRDVAFRFHQAADPEFQFHEIHFALIAAVVAVLLVACTNVANIQLARGIVRRRELALRSALGASRARLIRHLLEETTLLAAVGLGLGLVLTMWGSKALAASIPPSIGTLVVEPQMSWRVLVFALGATMFSLVVIGLLPSIGVSRTDPNDLLKSGAGTGATKSNRRRYAYLVAVEIALALALSTIATVAVRTTMLIGQAGAGFDPRPLATGHLAPTAPIGTVFRYSELLQKVEQRVRSIPGVSAATATAMLAVDNNAVSVDDAGGVREFMAPLYSAIVTTPSYVRTHGYRIVKGRDFATGERDHGAVIIDEKSARLLWPNADPIGRMVKLGDKKSNRPYVKVVGVMGDDPRFATRDELGVIVAGLPHNLGTMLYLPEPTDSIVAQRSQGVLVRLVARADERPSLLPVAIQHAEDEWSDFHSFGVKTMDEFLGLSRARDNSRFMAALFALFAVMGVGLAAFGVYGIVAHAVAERRRELGVRVALGGMPRDILAAVLRETVVVALAGVAGGLFLTRFGTTLLWQMARAEEMYDAPMFAAVAAVVVTTAALSAIAPAMRATRVDPTESLRAE